MPCVLDEEAATCPSTTFAVIPRSSDLADGFREVSYGEVANAVNKVAHQIAALFQSPPPQEFETLTFIGIPDLRYNIVFYAAVKAGYKVSPPIEEYCGDRVWTDGLGSSAFPA